MNGDKQAASPSLTQGNGSNTFEDSTDWQLSKARVIERFQYICNTERYADVHFIVGEEKQKIPAHKLVLCVGSPVFDRMFSTDWGSTTSEVEIEDMEPASFLALLKFLYYDHAEITADNVMSILNAAKRYAVPALEKHCANFLAEKLDASNAFSILTQATFFDVTELKEKCLEIIDAEATKAFESSEFLSIDFNTLCSFLKRNTLRIRENQLFQAVLRWANAECGRRKKDANSENQLSVLKEALYLIRFPLMSVDEFTSEVAESGLLSHEELNSMLMYFLSKKKPSIQFSEIPRSSPYLIAKRFKATDVDCSYPCNGNPNWIVFAVNRDIQLVGVGIYGSSNPSATYNVRFYLWDIDGGPIPGIVNEIQKANLTNSKGETFQLLFDNPWKLKKNIEYQVQFQIEGPNSFCGTESLSEAVMEVPGAEDQQVTVTFPGNVLRAQLPELLFTL